MGSNGIYEFIKWFYPQIRKQGLVVDVRGNGGGNVSQMILRRLMQKPLGLNYQAHSDWVGTYPASKEDAQLDRGIAEVLKRMAASPQVVPPKPESPVKTD